MIGKSRSEQPRIVIAALALLFAGSCAAPDAVPSAEKTEPDPLPDSGSDAGSDADAGSDSPDVDPVPPAGLPKWGKGFGVVGSDQHAFDIALDSSTNTIVTTMGFFGELLIPGVAGGIPFKSGGSRNILVVRHAAESGDASWAAPINSPSEIVRSVVDVDTQGNIIVAGGFNGTLTIGALAPAATVGSYDAYIAKFDPNGEPLWVRTFGDHTAQFVTGVGADDKGNIVVVGLASGNATTFGPGVVAPKNTDADIFIAKFDPDGTAVWAQRVGLAGSSAWQDPTATVAVSRVDGSILVGGMTGGTVDVPPLQLAAGGVRDGFIVKLDPQGKGVWQQSFGAKGREQRVSRVAFGPMGEALLTGSFAGEVMFASETLKSFENTDDLLVAKLEADGALAWAHGYGNVGKQVGTFCAFDEKGQAVVVGSFAGVLELFGNSALVNPDINLSTDVFAAKFGADGTPFWGRAFGDKFYQVAGGAVLWKDKSDSEHEDRVILAGMNNGTMDLGVDVLPIASAGLEDAFLLSLTH